MREFTVNAQDAGKRIDRYLLAVMPGAGAGQAQKLLRLKEIKVNGKPVKADARLEAGDRVKVFAPDEWFAKSIRPDPFLSKFRPKIAIAYEDDHLLIVDKRPGMVVHADQDEKVDTLVNHARAYLYQKGAYDPQSPFAPAPCNRIDRFTGGLVVVAKTPEALAQMDAAIRAHQVDKEYLMALRGAPRPAQGRLVHYMSRVGKHMAVFDRPVEGAQQAILDYETLYATGALALVKARLITGRTHQIRAQFSYIGHPPVGDTQYGDWRTEQAAGLGYQALYAWRLVFHFADGPLKYLDGKAVTCRHVPFVAALFPGYALL